MLWMLRSHQSPIDFAWINPTIHCFEIMKIAFMLIKNQGKWKTILKSKKICESAYLKRKVANLFKNEIFSDLKP